MATKSIKQFKMGVSSNKEVIQQLEHLLASSYVLYLKTQNYHWNVTGINFKSLHELFEDQYKELAEAIDEIAEIIRALGVKAPASFEAYSKLSIIKNGNENADSITMVKELSKDQASIIELLQHTLEVAQRNYDEVTADLLVGRMSAHRKNKWMLDSSI